MINLIAAIGTTEIFAVVLVIIVLFGGTKIPQLMRGLGRGVGELQKGLEEGKKSFEHSMKSEDEASGKTSSGSSEA